MKFGKKLIFDNNFIVSQGNILTKDQCNDIIEYFEKKYPLQIDSNYEYCDLNLIDEYSKYIVFGKYHLSDINIEPEIRSIINSLNVTEKKYFDTFPDISSLFEGYGGELRLFSFRFKKFKPGNSFNAWHSEYNLSRKNIVLSSIIYLSDNMSSTEFYRYGNIKSDCGTVAMFPSFFTHVHRGNSCKLERTRYIISAYYYLV